MLYEFVGNKVQEEKCNQGKGKRNCSRPISVRDPAHADPSQIVISMKWERQQKEDEVDGKGDVAEEAQVPG